MTNKQKRKETDSCIYRITNAEPPFRQMMDWKYTLRQLFCQWVISSFHLTTIPSCMLKEHKKNLLHMLKMNAQDIEEFWTLVTSPLSTISDSLQEDVPKAVCNSHQQVNSIQKCLWILRTKFRFIFTWKLNLSGLTSVRNTLHVLQQFQFPTIISVHSKCAVFDHIVVVWQGQVLDYESEVIYMLTEDWLHQLCGVNTTFSHISCGYGLFPPKRFSGNVTRSNWLGWFLLLWQKLAN